MNARKQKDALDYHASAPAGKIAVHPTKGMATQVDLSLAYSPGVAEPCLKIAEHPEDVYKYTAKGNLVAVISNGTAVLGLGNIGAAASKPVMEGKGVLFKKFAGIDVFDIEVAETDPDKFIAIVKALAPTFGGINLEDIKAPESFKIEEGLRAALDIPVMHDDQHGTAIISGSALLNALELVRKKIESLSIVVSGAGGAAIASANLYVSLGARRENIVMVDSKGVIRRDRENLAGLKAHYATERDLHTLSDAVAGADMFLGLSRANVLSEDMLLSMAARPIVFALANPDPEIKYGLALSTRKDIIMATGRSDHPNQVNNVLGFPYIFRGALDVRASGINEAMKLAAVQALADLAKTPVPDVVVKAYGSTPIVFGPEYFIPKPLDPRLITTVSPAVAQAAIESGLARHAIRDWTQYKSQLEQRIGLDTGLMAEIILRASRAPKRIVFSDGDSAEVLKASRMMLDEGIGTPILLGNKKRIQEHIHDLQLSLEGYEILDPEQEEGRRKGYAQLLFEKRKRKGITLHRAEHLVRQPHYFGALMVETGDADGYLAGVMDAYGQMLRCALEVIGRQKEQEKVAGMYVLSGEKGTYFLADTTVNIEPDVATLVQIAELSARFVRYLEHEPRIAMLSYSNFGSEKSALPRKVQAATRELQKLHPSWVLEGDLQANVALSAEILQAAYPFTTLQGKPANTLIFPNLASGNIAYKMLMELGGFEAIGPVLMGMRKPIHILQQSASVREIFNMAVITVLDAQGHEALKS